MGIDFDNLSPEPPESIQVPKTTKDMWGKTIPTYIISLIDSTLATIIQSYLSKIVTQGAAYIEKQWGLQDARMKLAELRKSLEQIENFQKEIMPYMKYLELVPELKQLFNTYVLGYIGNAERLVKSTILKLERYTYITDLTQAGINKLNDAVFRLIRLRELIKVLTK